MGVRNPEPQQGMLQPQQAPRMPPGLQQVTGLPQQSSEVRQQAPLQAWATKSSVPQESSSSSAGDQALQQGMASGDRDRNGAIPKTFTGARGSAAGGRATGVRREDPEWEEMKRLNIRGDRGRRRGGADQYLPIEVRPANCMVRNQEQLPASCVAERILVNHVPVVSDAELVRYQYNVDFAPQLENRSWMRQLVDEFMTEQKVAREAYSFNGFSMVYSRVQLLQERIEKLFNHPRGVEGAAEVEKVKVTLRFTNQLMSTSPEVINLCNVMLKNIQRNLGMVLIGDNYYFMRDGDVVNADRMLIVRGFNPSILRFESGLHLELDVIYRIIRTDTVADCLLEIQRNTKPENFERAALDEIVSCIVMTRYNKKTYRIDDIDFQSSPRSTFRKQDGSEVTYVQYFQEQYNISVNPNSLMLVSRPKRRDIRRGQRQNIYLPADVCYLTGLSDKMKSDYRIMQEVARHTRAEPQDRVNLIKRFLEEDLVGENREVMEQLGVRLGTDLMHVEAYRIRETRIVAGAREFGYREETADFGSELRNVQLDRAVPINYCLAIYTHVHENVASDFMDVLNRVMTPFGVNIQRWLRVVLPNAGVGTFVRAIQDNMNLNPRPTFVLVVLPKADKVLYDAVKVQCGLRTPIPSQCILEKTIREPRRLMSVATKVALQMQSKLGALLWHVRTPNLPPILVVGIDVYHDSVNKQKSVAAFCASMNQHMTQYYSRSVHQARGQEIIDTAGVHFSDILKKYYDINGRLPTHVFVFRDGVGDGQLAAVHEHEVPQFTDALKHFSPDPAAVPKLAYIIVKKRINQRFFRCVQNGRVGNPLPGTVIDRSVTRPEWLDYFIVSQSVRQGTVSPTHYNVIYDDMGWPTDRIHKFTYWLTHLYYNWPGTIRVPAPCQYAHKLAFIIGQSIHGEVDPSLWGQLWFL